MKYEELKCEFCDGAGEVSRDSDGMAIEHECHYCNGTGIDNEHLNKLMNERLVNRDCIQCGSPFSMHGQDMNCPNFSIDGTLLGWRITKFIHF